MMKKPDFLQVHINSWKLNIDWKYWSGLQKNRCGHSGNRTLKLALYQKWNNGINWFFTNSEKLKVASIIFGRGFLEHETLKFTVSQEWASFLHANTNLGKLSVGWTWSKMGQTF